MQRKQFQTRRLVLRPYRKSDYREWLYAYTCGHPKKSKYDSAPFRVGECSPSIFSKMRLHHVALAKKDHSYVWAMFDKKSKRLVGVISVFIICRDLYQAANLGYRVFNLYWRLGYAREALEGAIPKILLTLKLNRLQAIIDGDNPASLGLAKKVMKPEGITKNYYYQNKRWDDQHVFSATRKDLRLPTLHPKILKP